MSNQDVEFETEVIGGTNFIKVDRGGIRLYLGEIVEFQNELEVENDDSDEEDVDADISFYPFLTTTSKTLDNAVEGFCKGETGKVFTVNGDSTRVCEVLKSGDFLYSITADSHHTLDPVIIVEPPGPGGSFLPILAAAVGVGIGVGATYMAMKWAHARGVEKGQHAA